MKHLKEMLTEENLSTVDISTDALVSGCKSKVNISELTEVINRIMSMGYKPVVDTPFTDKFNTYFFYLFSKGKTSDMVLISCCSRGRHKHQPYIIAYTSNKSQVSKLSDDEILVSAKDGFKKSKKIHLNCQEMVDIYINECNFGEYDEIVKKANWYTKAKYWMKNEYGISRFHVLNFYN